MPLPIPDREPPFDVTRCSHVRLTVRDLERSLRFYTQFIGLTVTAVEFGAAYLRGVEEVCHHSLVLRQVDGRPSCECIGMRVRTGDDLERASDALMARGLVVERLELPHQGPSLRFADPSGAQVELCSKMEAVARHAVSFEARLGAAPTGLDHYQLHVTDPDLAAAFYSELGFRMSEYITADGRPHEPLLGVFLARKGNANDLVMVRNPGPRLHHFSYVIHNAPVRMVELCDRASALGYAELIEWGPSRHGLGDEIFLYLRDPDGHRIELLSHPYRFMDEEEQPFGWARHDGRVASLWGPDAPASWFEQASTFTGVPVAEPRADGQAAA